MMAGTFARIAARNGSNSTAQPRQLVLDDGQIVMRVGERVAVPRKVLPARREPAASNASMIVTPIAPTVSASTARARSPITVFFGRW